MGTLPSLELDSNDDIGGGRMLPTLSIDHYGASLAQWFGLTNNEIAAVFPNISRFDPNALQLFKG